MNNILKILLLLFITTFNVYAQDISTYEAPYIKIYSRDDYNAHDQNWNVAQDSLGMIYVANNAGILVFDGNVWDEISMENVWGLSANYKGEVYFGADNILGKIEYGKFGEIKIKLLNEQLPEEKRNTGVIRNVQFIGDSTYFIGFRNVYLFYKDSLINTYVTKSRISFSYIYNNQIFFICNLSKLYQISENNIVPVSINKRLFSNQKINLFSYKNGTIILTDSAVYYSDSKNVNLVNGRYKIIDKDFNKKIKKLSFTNAVLLSNDKICFYSTKYGILVYDIKTKEKTFINEYNGLSSNFVTAVYEDNHKNLWVSTYEGINYIELNFPFRTISAGNLTSNIITEFNELDNGDMVYTTLSGVYKIKKIKKSNQILIHSYGIKSSFVGIVGYDGRIFSSNTMGIGEIKDDKYNQLIDFEICYIFRKLEFNSQYMVLAGGEGIAILKYQNGKIKKVHTIRSYNIDVRYVVEDNGYIWFSKKKGVVSRFKTDEILTDTLLVEDFYFSDSTNTNNIFVNKICEKLVVEDKNAFKIFDYKTNKFIVTQKCKHLKDFGAIELSSFDNGTNWLSNTEELTSVNCETGEISKSNVFLKRINNIKVQSLYNDKRRNLIWVGGTNKIGVIDKRKIDPDLYTFRIKIRNIRINDSTIFYGYNLNDSIQRIFKKRSKFLFNYAAQYYRATEENRYSYILEGYDKEWSGWTDINFANYTNLDYGDYIFKVKAKNIFGKISKIEEYRFSVEPDFYQTWYAKSLLAIFVMLVIYLTIYLNSKRLKLINLKLEKQVEERTLEINEKNIELEKLSIVASETDNSVLIYDKDYNLEWVNEGVKKNFGYTLEQLYEEFGKNILDISFYPKITEVINEIEKTKKSVTYNSKGKKRDGNQIWSRTTLTPIVDKDNNTYKIIAIDSDITELKHAEEKIIKQNSLIKDSLEYAKKIQEAVLPSLNNLKETFKDAFVIFKPKDIVSGDFFWIHTIDNKTIVATADCTGHGVPGGFMSMIGNTMMNEIVKEKKITSPSDILNLMDKKIKDLFKDAESGQADGMDVAVAVIDKTVGTIEVASANQSMYIVNDNEVLEYEGDMWSIGGVFSINEIGVFQSKEYKISNNTTLFMSSDGYQDQFGGENDTKILKTKFIEILQDVSSKSSDEQEKILNDYFENWKGKEKQTDDILVIGIKL